ncbi:MAG: cobalamin biosynthesis protein CobQ [Kangiellaceae bacterium]|nr:cobalamin biosynthesis protein CobQ [Kangiellaceae bacterium]
MRVWTVANQKGGVGKTTTTVTLGGLMAGSRRRVLLVDLDPHGSMTYYFGFKPDQQQKGVYTLFENPNLSSDAIMELTLPTEERNLSLLPSSMALATLDRQLSTQDGMGLMLKKVLDKVADRFEMVLIDCPPVLGVLMVNALAACDHVVIPVQTEFLALQGLERMDSSMQMVGKALKSTFPHTIVPTLFDRRTRACIQALRTLREDYGDRVWRSVIPVDTRFRDASLAHIPASTLAPECRGVDSYKRLLKYLLSVTK